MAHGSHESHGHVGHILPFSLYVKVLVVLLILTVITVAVSRVDLGVMNIVVAMFVASIKAGIVAAFFMHLKYENPTIWIYVAFPLILLVVMIGGLYVDNPFRTDPKIYIEEAKKPAAAHGAEHKADDHKAPAH